MTTASCSEASAEVVARIRGQYDDWHDPHNNGTYTLTGLGMEFDFLGGNQSFGGNLSTSRLTGDRLYEDKQFFVLSSSGSGDACTIEACSRSQVPSRYDDGTNYCNLKMLYCGSGDGCSPVKHDFALLGAEETERFAESTADLERCLVV